MNQAYINAGIGALELFANLAGRRSSGGMRNAASATSGRTSGS